MKQLKKCIIVGAGEFSETNLPIESDDLLIAADGGLDYLTKLNIKPNLFIGDMDSVKANTEKIEKLVFPTKKDDSDMLLSVNKAINRGFQKFYIFGGLGGRIDHTIANIKILQYLAEKGLRGYLFGKEEVITAIKNEKIVFSSDFNGNFSIFALGGKALGVYEIGSEYTLTDYTLGESSSIGLSNRFCQNETVVSVRDGIIAVIFTRQGDFKVGN